MGDKPTVKLVNKDGNAFVIMGKVIKALRTAGMYEEANLYWKEARMEDYDHLLRTTMEYVNIE